MCSCSCSNEAMDEGNMEGYIPSEEYNEESRDPLFDISLSDSKELWLIQWPYKQTPDFDGKELSLELHANGPLGSFEDSSGKAYDLVSCESRVPDATVFQTCASGPKIVGKISRRVSLVHYAEPKELLEKSKSSRLLYQTPTRTFLSSSSCRFSTPTQSSWRTNSQSTRTHSIKYNSTLSEAGDDAKTPKRRHADNPNWSTDRSTLDSGWEHSTATFSGSSEQSHQKKSEKKMKG